jgi:hypothetical protein
MHRISRARTALALLAAAASIALPFALSPAPSSASGSPPHLVGPVYVRVEGPTGTLVPTVAVNLTPTAVEKDGRSADSCSGLSAAGALQQATHGSWGGTWYASYHSYLLTTIDRVKLSASKYWAFWVNNAPASQGICGYDPKFHDSLLFFPECDGKGCPPAAGVLAISAAQIATVGEPFNVAVTAYNETSGKPAKAAGVTVSAGGASATTGAGGSAALTFAHAGRFELSAQKRDAIRTETAVCVQTAAAKSCDG